MELNFPFGRICYKRIFWVRPVDPQLAVSIGPHVQIASIVPFTGLIRKTEIKFLEKTHCAPLTTSNHRLLGKQSDECAVYALLKVILAVDVGDTPTMNRRAKFFLQNALRKQEYG